MFHFFMVSRMFVAWGEGFGEHFDVFWGTLGVIFWCWRFLGTCCNFDVFKGILQNSAPAEMWR